MTRMTYEEVKERFKEFGNYCDDYCDGSCEKCSDMEDRIINALDKQIPKKPVYFKKIGKYDNGQDLYAKESYPMCPVCETQLDYGCRCSNNDCGQKIDWSVTDK